MSDQPVVVTGANGFVGAEICRALVEHGARVHAVVRRSGTAPALAGLVEHVGDVRDPDAMAPALAGARALVSTVHPMGAARAVQHAVGVAGTRALAQAAAAAGAARVIHISTAAVYDRSPGVGDVEETSALVGDDANDYAVTKRDADLALAALSGPTRVLLRPPAILGPGPSSTWNTLRPAEMRESGEAGPVNPEATFAWVHVRDLARLAADLATGAIPDAGDSESAGGPAAGACTALNVAAPRATQRDYVATASRALGLDPQWSDEPGWTGSLRADRARSWGWTPEVSLAEALAELVAGLDGTA
ncbi:MAG TPA: NAD-dependent epimerase/dehydratase family protein [Solirubrobacteraceae bacterium]|nr:NAD-dependent epimerase/dehydratase family protein [Solirubrobacteraceae bacterium]